MKDLLTIKDLEIREIKELFTLTTELKYKKNNGDWKAPIKDNNYVYLFKTPRSDKNKSKQSPFRLLR